jgi:2-octaprenyl-6-methoxyphenol hydroxylase
MDRMAESEIAVVGAGLAGLIAAIAAAKAGASTTLFAPPAAAADRRTTALLGGSVQALEHLGVWQVLRAHAAPLARLRLVDVTHNLVRAPEVTFHASELGLDAFGFNIENEVLGEALRAAAACLPNLTITDRLVEAVLPDAETVTLRTGEGGHRARLLVAADGRNSICREAAGIAVTRTEFPQTALTMNLKHRRPHDDTSTEFHTETGPFTLVPLPGERSSLVWVTDPPSAEMFASLDDAALAREIERRAHSILGSMEIDGGRGKFPIESIAARRFAQQRIVLAGDAGHLLPPIGAQGLNLGIRDAVAIADLVRQAKLDGADLGGDALLNAYDSARQADVRSRSFAVEMVNRSLLSDFLPVHALRGLGLQFAASFGPLRRLLMRQGLGPEPASSS